jgi:hypothetical protein
MFLMNRWLPFNIGACGALRPPLNLRPDDFRQKAFLPLPEGRRTFESGLVST